MEKEPDNQQENSVKNKKPEHHLTPFQWKKGQSGNAAGRPKGKTMKEYAKELLECQSEEERQDFLHGLPKEVIWKMAEGNPESKGELKTTGDINLNLTDPKLVKLAEKFEKELKDNINAPRPNLNPFMDTNESN